MPGQNNETWFDRAHSVFFDYLSETGIVGLLSYLGIFAVFAWEFFKTHRRKKTASVVLAGIILAIPVAYLGQGIAIFDVFPMYLSSFLFLAFATYLFRKNGRLFEASGKAILAISLMDRNTKQVIAVIVILVVFAVAAYGSYLPMRKAEIFISTLQGLPSSPVSSLDRT